MQNPDISDFVILKIGNAEGFKAFRCRRQSAVLCPQQIDVSFMMPVF